MDKTRKILMLGNKDSGKTTYMVSAYGAMKMGRCGFHVYGDEDTDAWLMELYSQIRNGQYPMPTEKRNLFDFNLYYYQHQVLSFQWVDYFGGVITEGKSQELMKDIDDADAILIFLDAKVLAGEKPMDSQLRRILYLIGKKLANTERTFDVLAVVTKCDLIGSLLPFEAVTKPLENLENILSARENIHFRIVPVSCTAKRFMNVELPLLDILYTGLKENHDYHVDKSLEHTEQAESYARDAGLFDWMISKLLGVKTNGELAREETAAAQQEQDIWKKLSPALKRLQAYRDNYLIEIPTFAGEHQPQPVKRGSRFKNM